MTTKFTFFWFDVIKIFGGKKLSNFVLLDILCQFIMKWSLTIGAGVHSRQAVGFTNVHPSIFRPKKLTIPDSYDSVCLDFFVNIIQYSKNKNFKNLDEPQNIKYLRS